MKIKLTKPGEDCREMGRAEKERCPVGASDDPRPRDDCAESEYYDEVDGSDRFTQGKQ